MDGILVIDKPAGWTSHDVVARVLVVLVGRATRLAQFLAGAEKEYEATVRLGYATDTGDLTGRPRPADGAAIKPCAAWGDEEIEAALQPLRGEIEQVPPMYSAKKVA